MEEQDSELNDSIFAAAAARKPTVHNNNTNQKAKGGMFDDTIMEESMMNDSNASMDLGNLSSIFGTSKKPMQQNQKFPEPIMEEEEDERKNSMFTRERYDTMSKFSETTTVLDVEQKQRLNSLFNDNFKDKEDLSPIKKPNAPPAKPVEKKAPIFEEDEDLDESIMFESKKPSPPPHAQTQQQPARPSQGQDLMAQILMGKATEPPKQPAQNAQA